MAVNFSKKANTSKNKKKMIVLCIIGAVLLLIISCTVTAFSKKSDAISDSRRLLNDIQIANLQPAYNKVQGSGCETQAGAFTQWYLKCSVIGDKFYRDHGDTASLVHDINVLDKKLRASGWRTYDDATSVTSRVPTAEDVELGKPNGTAFLTVYYMPSHPNLELTVTYITSWTSHKDRPYKSINTYPDLSGDNYLFGFSLFNDYINISS